MKHLSKDQRKALADVCGNIVVVWLAGGVISPYLSGMNLTDMTKQAGVSFVWAGAFLFFMLWLSKGGKV